MLRNFIRATLVETGWEDPDAVMFKFEYGDENEDEDNDDELIAQEKINKSAEKNTELQKRDNYSNSNSSMSSFKPLAPRNTGGPQSGRKPGGSGLSATSRGYSAGY